VGDATRALHERVQWQLRLWPAADAFYRESIAAAAAAAFVLSRRAPG
jgi:hypothetical protein